jgi:hypothetical protein
MCPLQVGAGEGVEDAAAGGAARVEGGGAVAAMDPEMVVVLAIRAGQAVGVEQAEELVVAGGLVHEVGQGRVHRGSSRVSVGPSGWTRKSRSSPGEPAHQIRLMSQEVKPPSPISWTLSTVPVKLVWMISPFDVAGHEQGRVLEGVAIEEQLIVGRVQALMPAFVLEREEPPVSRRRPIPACRSAWLGRART